MVHRPDADCRRHREALAAALEGDLAAAEAEWMERHERSCPACRRTAMRARRVDEAVARLPAPSPPPDFADRVLREVRARFAADEVDCEQLLEDLWPWRLGDLPERRRRALARHVESCPLCARELAVAERVERALRSWTPPPLPRDFGERLLRTLGSRRPAARFARFPGRAALAVAATFLVALSFAAWHSATHPSEASRRAGAPPTPVQERLAAARPNADLVFVRNEQYPDGVGTFDEGPILADRRRRSNGAFFHDALRRALSEDNRR